MAKIRIKANNNTTMYDLAKIFGTTVAELRKYNNLDSNIIHSGKYYYWETDDIEGVRKRYADLQKYFETKQSKLQETYSEQKRQQNLKKLKEFTQEEDYGDLTQHQINDYHNFKKMGLGKTVEDFKRYKEQESKSAQETRKQALLLGTGVVAGAALSNPLTINMVNSAVHNPVIGSITRSIVGSYIGLTAAKQAGLDETGLKIAGYLGGGFGGLSKNVFKFGADLGLKAGAKYITAEGLSNTVGYAATGEAYEALDKAGYSNKVKVPLSMLAGFWGRRGFNSGLRNSVKNTTLGSNLIQQKAYDPSSAFSSQGHVLPKLENTGRMIDYYLNQTPTSTWSKTLLAPVRGLVKGLHAIDPSDKLTTPVLNGIAYTGALTLKSMPIAGIGLATGATMDYASNLVPKKYSQLISSATNFVMPILLNKSFGALNNFNRGQANYITYVSGGTGAGFGSALQNAAKISLGMPKQVNMDNVKLTKSQLAKGLATSFWDSLPIHRTSNGFGRNYKPGGYGLLYWNSKGLLGGNWANLNRDLYQGKNPISHLFFNAPLGKGVVSTGKYIRLGSNKNPRTPLDDLLHNAFGKTARYGDRPIEIVVTGNRVDPSKGSWATSFTKSGTVTATSRNPKDAKFRPSSYNADTGIRRTGARTTNLAVNTKGQPAAVYIDEQGRQFSVGTDLYGVGSGKKTLFESIYGSFMDANTNPMITVSFNKYTPAKSRMGGTQSFGSEVFKNLPIYAE